MVTLDPNDCRNLLEVVDDLHGRKSTAISSQLPVAKWHGLFEDATIAEFDEFNIVVESSQYL